MTSSPTSIVPWSAAAGDVGLASAGRAGLAPPQPDMTKPAGLPAGFVVSSCRTRCARLGGYSTRTCMNWSCDEVLSTRILVPVCGLFTLLHSDW